MDNPPIPRRWHSIVKHTGAEVNHKESDAKVEDLFALFHNYGHQKGAEAYVERSSEKVNKRTNTKP